MEQLTVKQERVLEAIKVFMAKNGYPPTVREIGTMINLRSSATIHAHITLLEEKGYLKKGLGKNRTIELLVPNEFQEKVDGVISVPFLSNDFNGNLEESLKCTKEYLKLPREMVPSKKEVFALSMSGKEMMNKGIYDNDILIIERKNTADNKDIVVVSTKEDKLFVAEFTTENNKAMLTLNNDFLNPIFLDDKTILGKVISLYRKF